MFSLHHCCCVRTWFSTSMAISTNISWSSLMLLSSLMMSLWRASISFKACWLILESMIWGGRECVAKKDHYSHYRCPVIYKSLPIGQVKCHSTPLPQLWKQLSCLPPASLPAPHQLLLSPLWLTERVERNDHLLTAEQQQGNNKKMTCVKSKLQKDQW